MDRDVAQTLAVLERKLAELERELTHVTRTGGDPGETAALYSQALRGTADHAPSSLGQETPPHAAQHPSHAASDPPHAASDPPYVSHPPHAAPHPPPPLAPPRRYPSMGALIDEAVERRYSMDAQETVFGEIPATKDAQQSIDVEDLVRFKEKMQSTLQGLIDEYSRLLSLKPPTDV